ncbi:DUF4365 domain-containing protein [Mycolicibacterium sp. XJ662]
MGATTAGAGGLSPVVRGSPERLKDLMEQYQQAHVQGVASAAGCVVSEPRIDEGVDLILTHKANQHRDDKVARLEVQLKATAHELSADGSRISVSMKKDRYNYFRTPSPIIPKIVVIMHLPKKQDDWLSLGKDYTQVHYGAYWVNLEEKPETDAPTITVSAPTANKFTDVELCKMMVRIGQGGKP